MIRFARFIMKRILSLIKYLVQICQVLRRLIYVLLLIASAFLVQLHACLFVADYLGVLRSAEASGLYPIFDWSTQAERFLVCYGLFLWLGYILPSRNGFSLWTQGSWAQWHPLRVAFFHVGCWVVIWGPLASYCGLYEGMSSVGILACMATLAGMYYVQVWQDIVERIKHHQTLAAQSKRFPRRSAYAH